MEIAARWLDQVHVVVTPGSAFYAPGWIRLSYATSLEKLKEATGRIRRLMNPSHTRHCGMNRFLGYGVKAHLVHGTP